jgi:hypothetical protein
VIITVFIDPFMCVIAASINSDSIKFDRRKLKDAQFWHFCDITYGTRYACM